MKNLILAAFVVFVIFGIIALLTFRVVPSSEEEFNLSENEIISLRAEVASTKSIRAASINPA